jgi:hypothetical protein
VGNLRASDFSAEAAAAAVSGAAEAQDRRVSLEVPRARRFGFGAMLPERRHEIAAQGAAASVAARKAKPSPRPAQNAKDRFDLTWEEFWDYGALRAKGLDPEAAAQAIYQRRAPAVER